MIRSNTKVTFQKSKALFKKCVGTYLHADGEPRAQIWWFTGNHAESRALADIVIDFYQRDVVERGAKHWTPELVTQVKASLKRYRMHLVDQHARATETLARLSEVTPQSAPIESPKPAPAAATLSKAAETYIGEMKARQTAGQISACHVRSQEERLTFALKGIDDKPIAELTDADVTTMILRLASLPMRRSGHRHKKRTQKRISVTTARNCLKTLRWFLVWADETERWNAPKRLNKLFKQVRFKEQLTDEDAEVPHYDLEQLKSLWHKADDRLKTWIALGLNCAFAQTELATLKRAEIRLGSDPHIARFRQKSNVYAKWTLWPETVDLLKTNIQKSGDLALVNEAGAPLVIETLDHRLDSIGPSWQRLAKRAEVPGTFKLLRKTAAWMIKQIAGLEVSEMILAHIEGSTTGAGKMNKHYAARDWQKLTAALQTMRDQLIAAEVLTKTPEQSEVKTIAKAA